MPLLTPTTISLRERENLFLKADDLSEREAREIESHGRAGLTAEPPSYRTGHVWRVSAGDTVGAFRLSTGRLIRIEPKLKLRSVFEMLEYAWNLRAFLPDQGLVGCGSLEDLYERLARVLLKRTLARIRFGLHATYKTRRERLAFIRGRVLVGLGANHSPDPRLLCEYEEHTRDIKHNQLVFHTVHRLARSGLLGASTSPLARRAHHALAAAVTPRAFRASDCSLFSYDRLDADYEPIHALCRFFLEHSGPAHEDHQQRMVPFLLDMPRLFERSVAVWLAGSLPEGLRLREKPVIEIDSECNVAFYPDLVLEDAASGTCVAVIDTKYKAALHPKADDVQQVIAYAHALGSPLAILLYPTSQAPGMDVEVRGVHIRSLTFDVRRGFDEAGRRLLREANWSGQSPAPTPVQVEE